MSAEENLPPATRQNNSIKEYHMKKRLVSLLVLIAMVFTMTVIGTTGVSAADVNSVEFTPATHALAATFDKMPHTFEAVIELPTSYTERPGVIIGNYGAAADCISFELSAGGLPRLYYQEPTTAEYSTVYNYVFNEVDVRSDNGPVRVTMVHDPDAATITCYLNGEAKQTLDAAGLPEIITTMPQMLGGDYRGDNAQFFKGKIYSVAVYADVLSADEVKTGTVNYADPDLLAAFDFTGSEPNKDLSGHGCDVTGTLKVVAPEQIRLIPQLKNHITLPEIIADMPLTFDAVVSLPTSYADRAGSISGSYVTTTEPFFNFDVWSGGQPRLMVYDANIAQHNFHFTEVDIRSDGAPVRVTISMNPAEKTITCYLNGEAKQTLTIPDTYAAGTLPQLIAVGSDNRAGNDQFFKGTLYQFSMYSEALTADEIASGTDKGLIAKYDFTTTENPNADLSGNGNDLVGELFIADPVALLSAEPEFTEGLTFEDAAMLYQTGEDGYSDVPYTYAAWLYLSKTVDGRGGVVIGNYQSGSIPCVSFEISTVGVPRFYHIDLNNKVTDLKFMDADVRIGDWVHVAFTVTDVVTCYVNGEPVGEQPIGEFESLATEMPIGIGGDLRGGNGQNFKGRIREIVLFEDALTPMEISTLYNNGAAAVGKDILAHYDLTNAVVGEDIEDISGNGYTAFADPRFFEEKDPVTDYAYSFAFIGDTQVINANNPAEFSKIYDWLAANKDEKKIQHVFGLGDITDGDTAREWQTALEGISKLDGVIPYSLVRGNHDSVAKFTETFGTDTYKSQFEGFYNDELANSWRTLKAGSTDYLLITLDYGANDDVLNWASEIITSHPDHKVIITTHCYLFRDGTTLDAGDVCPPSNSGGTNNGDHMWDKLISKHANIVLVVSGHDPNDTIVKKQTKGENGNTVTQVLIDPQGAELGGPMGMVAMFYFSEDGSEIEVEYFSTVREKFFMIENQFSMTIPSMEEKPAETEPAETAAPETEAADTEAAGSTDVDAPAETDSTAAPAPIAGEEKGGSAGIIIGVVAAVVVIGAAAGIVIAKKKKN